MSTVPYLAPISYVLIRTLITSFILLVVGNIHEGHIPFPPLFRDDQHSIQKELSLQVGLLNPSNASSGIASTASGNSVGLSLSKPNSANSLNVVFNRNNKKMEVEEPHPLLSSPKQHHHHHRPRRRKGRQLSFKKYVIMAIHSIIPSLWMILQNILLSFNLYKQQINNLNPEAVQIIFAGLSGMLLLPISYTTGLILTSPTVASVWDGPMIPLGCFCTAVTLGLEKRSKSHPFGQVGSLLLAVGGGMAVLLVDYMGGGHGIGRGDGGSTKDAKISNGGGGVVNDHMQFIQGNMVLMGVVASYSATALLQKRLNHYPPLQLTGWMFGIGFAGCFTLLLLDSILGSRITGCTLGEALGQLYIALATSPTFRYGLLYSAIFVSGVTMSINSYASSHLESSVITLFAAIQPPITAVLELIWEGKGLGWKKLCGMGCVCLGMWCFTYIKRMEKEESVDGCHRKKMEVKQFGNHANLNKAQDYENGINVQVGYSNGEGSPKNNGRSRGPNLTNRKAHADV